MATNVTALKVKEGPIGDNFMTHKLWVIVIGKLIHIWFRMGITSDHDLTLFSISYGSQGFDTT